MWTWLSCLEETGDRDTEKYLCPSGSWGCLQCSGTTQCFRTAIKMDQSNPCYQRKTSNRAKVDRKGQRRCDQGPWTETTASAEKGKTQGHLPRPTVSAIQKLNLQRALAADPRNQNNTHKKLNRLHLNHQAPQEQCLRDLLHWRGSCSAFLRIHTLLGRNDHGPCIKSVIPKQETPTRV